MMHKIMANYEIICIFESKNKLGFLITHNTQTTHPMKQDEKKVNIMANIPHCDF